MTRTEGGNGAMMRGLRRLALVAVSFVFILQFLWLPTVSAATKFERLADVEYPVAASSTALEDLDGDGFADLVTVHDFDWPLNLPCQLVVRMSNGDGTFADPVDYVLDENWPAAAQQFTLADINNDGYLDAAVTVSNQYRVVILLGNGDGTFGAQPHELRFSDNWYPQDVAVRDFDGDGLCDLAVVIYDPAQVAIFIQSPTPEGELLFREPQFYPAGGCAHTLAVADFNNDGWQDIAVANQDDDVSILLNDKSNPGVFIQAGSYPFEGYAEYVETGDFNGDGEVDLAVGSDCIYILLGKGDGTFTDSGACGGSPGYGPGFLSLAVADFDLDGKLDIAATSNADDLDLEIFPGNGDGTFGLPLAYDLTPSSFHQYNPGMLSEGDIDGDGYPDLAVASWDSTTVRVLRNTGTHVYPVEVYATPDDAGEVAGGGYYAEGEQVTVTVTPYDYGEYEFVGWTEGDSVVSTDQSYTFIMPAAGRSLNAVFREKLYTYTLSLSVNPIDGGSVTGAGEYGEGATVTVTATPKSGYSFVNWTDSTGVEWSKLPSFTFGMPYFDLNLTANFTRVLAPPAWPKGTKLSVISTTTDSVTLKINNLAANAGEYRVYVGGVDWTDKTVFSGQFETDRTFTVTGLNPGTNYVVTIQGVSGSLTTPKDPSQNVRTVKVKTKGKPPRR